MSKGFGKKALLQNKKSSKTNSTASSPGKGQQVGTEEDDKLMVKFVFEGEKFHARTPICFDQLILSDMLRGKISLDITLPPPSAQELFEMYFKEDIYPYIRHNIQSQIRNKRDITKLWDLQSIILQKIYEDRAKLLKDEWLLRRNKDKHSKNRNNHNGDDDETIKKKEKLKAKNAANKQKWKDQIAMQIASGIFDDEKPKEKNNKNEHGKSHKNKKRDKKDKNNNKSSKGTKPSKPVKKKKIKKWKDKKVKKVDEWPTMNKNIPTPTPINKVNNNKNNMMSNKLSAAQQLKEKLKKLETNQIAQKHQNKIINGHNINKKQSKNNNMNMNEQVLLKKKEKEKEREIEREREKEKEREKESEKERLREKEKENNKILIRSQLKYKMLIRSENDKHLISDENDSKQIEEIKPYIDSLQNMNELTWIKIWIYIESKELNKNHQIWLNTDKDQIQLRVNQSKLFEILWNDFGNDVKKRIDSPNIDVAFIKKSKALRVKIPMLSL